MTSSVRESVSTRGKEAEQERVKAVDEFAVEMFNTAKAAEAITLVKVMEVAVLTSIRTDYSYVRLVRSDEFGTSLGSPLSPG